MYSKEYTVEELNQIGVYRIITPGGAIYIGMTTTSFNERWKGHHKDLNNGKHKCQGLKNSYDYYNKNWKLFQCEIIKSWDRSNDKEMLKLLQKEILFEEKLAWIRHKNSGYRMIHGCPTGTGSVNHTNESKEKLSKTLNKKFSLKLQELFYSRIDEIKEMALDPNLSINDISKNIGLGRETISKEFKNNNIKNIYKNSNSKSTKINRDILIENKNEIINKYSQNYSIKELSLEYNISTYIIKMFLKENGVVIRPIGNIKGKQSKNYTPRKYINKGIPKNLYKDIYKMITEDKMTTREVAKEINFSQPAIVGVMKKINKYPELLE